MWGNFVLTLSCGPHTVLHAMCMPVKTSDDIYALLDRGSAKRK